MSGARTEAEGALPVWKRLLFYSVLVLLPIAVALVAGETFVRLTRPHVDLWVQTGREPGPNPVSEWAVVDAFSAYRARPGAHGDGGGKTVNRHGFISTPDLAVVKPPGTVRIAFLGGSSTAGMGHLLSDEETWPWQTIRILRERFPDRRIELINAALGGYSSFESFGRLWSRVRFFAPDIIVVYHGWNEMYYFDDPARARTWRTLPDGSWTLDRTPTPIERYEPLWIDHLIGPSQLLVRVRLRLAPGRAGEVGAGGGAELASEYDPEGPEVWRTNLRLIRSAARIMGAELFVARQATLVVEGLPEEERARVGYHLHGFDHPAHVRAFREIYRVIEEELDPDAVVDLTTLSGRPDLFHDHVHPTVSGAREIARIVADALAERSSVLTSPLERPATR